MSLFKKPKKTFRTRRADEDSDGKDEEDDDVIIESFMPASLLKEPKVKKPKRKKTDRDHGFRDTSTPKSESSSKLSFEDNEGDEEEVFQIKKSSHSRRIAKQLKKEHKKEKEEAEKIKQEQFSASGTYTDETLKQLRREQESQNGLAPVDMELGSDVELPPEGNSRQESEDDIPLVEEEEEPAKRKPDPFGGNKVQELIATGQIPDAAMIHLARKHRQRAREQGDDFIPVDDTVKYENPSSRLIREDDNDRSEDDERVSFTVSSREQQLRSMQNTILEAEQGSHSEGSDHESEWERQQIRKGVTAGATNQPDVDDTTKKYQQYFFGNVAPSTYPNGGASSNGNVPTNILATRAAPPKNLPPITLETIKKRLKDRLDELGSIHRAHVHERDDIVSRMENCSLDINTKAGTKGGLESRYRFFQQTRGYVRDLVECLAEKMTSINFMDRCMMLQWKQRAEKLVKRHQQDIQDQSRDYMPNKTAVVQGLSATDTPEDQARQRRAAEREARRARRRRAREACNVTNHHEGMSTDDEENKSETAKFQLERDRIQGTISTMFEDTVEDFCDFDMIKSRFRDWRKEQGDTYHEAYISLCLPRLFTPLVKLNLINWNPLEANCRNFEESNWYEALMFYGHEDGQHVTEDNDVKLVPSIIDKLILARLLALVDTVWDPMSTKQTKRLVLIMCALIQDYPTVNHDSKNTQALLQAIVQRIRKTLDDDVFMPLYPKQVLENKNSGASLFFNRQFWSCVKLLGNILEWHSILSDSLLQELSLDCLLNRYMVFALHNSVINSENIAKCQAITSLFPQSWFTDLPTDSTIPQLQNLCRHLVNAATSLNTTLATTESEVAKVHARENMKQIRKMLVIIHSMDNATALADRFSLRS